MGYPALCLGAAHSGTTLPLAQAMRLEPWALKRDTCSLPPDPGLSSFTPAGALGSEEGHLLSARPDPGLSSFTPAGALPLQALLHPG